MKSNNYSDILHFVSHNHETLWPSSLHSIYKKILHGRTEGTNSHAWVHINLRLNDRCFLYRIIFVYMCFSDCFLEVTHYYHANLSFSGPVTF